MAMKRARRLVLRVGGGGRRGRGARLVRARGTVQRAGCVRVVGGGQSGEAVVVGFVIARCIEGEVRGGHGDSQGDRNPGRIVGKGSAHRMRGVKRISGPIVAFDTGLVDSNLV